MDIVKPGVLNVTVVVVVVDESLVVSEVSDVSVVVDPVPLLFIVKDESLVSSAVSPDEHLAIILSQ